MSIAEIKDLPMEYKLQIMEELWGEMRVRLLDMPIPLEHQRLLDERRTQVAQGQSCLHRWEDVKQKVGHQ